MLDPQVRSRSLLLPPEYSHPQRSRGVETTIVPKAPTSRSSIESFCGAFAGVRVHQGRHYVTMALVVVSERKAPEEEEGCCGQPPTQEREEAHPSACRCLQWLSHWLQ